MKTHARFVVAAWGLVGTIGCRGAPAAARAPSPPSSDALPPEPSSWPVGFDTLQSTTGSFRPASLPSDLVRLMNRSRCPTRLEAVKIVCFDAGGVQVSARWLREPWAFRAANDRPVRHVEFAKVFGQAIDAAVGRWQIRSYRSARHPHGVCAAARFYHFHNPRIEPQVNSVVAEPMAVVHQEQPRIDPAGRVGHVPVTRPDCVLGPVKDGR